ncbi:MAG: hypothetical protein JWR67_87 [Mucilaginibacter sp.]|nr:hypothetical protein [Mucilaginibacter sp.]
MYTKTIPKMSGNKKTLLLQGFIISIVLINTHLH